MNEPRTPEVFPKGIGHEGHEGKKEEESFWCCCGYFFLYWDAPKRCLLIC
ncbi:hypothetical protein [Sphaerospermopsis torques-reginae]|uniref:Uncharacterized protein n=1 Tax=Sphaerospermopsis torques-reginae ITEP-024 TaxID=984208 RepID=A0ABX8X2J6_9CYAN|nr:hypothetical protein [Sphaerospermopsis torques-reginae]QYX32901.1 hypothetical protein K2F26_06015 [Sphaerospermopsis torques-reginae ITEP-024]